MWALHPTGTRLLFVLIPFHHHRLGLLLLSFPATSVMQPLTLVLTTLLSALALFSLATASPIADRAAVNRSEDYILFKLSFICPNQETIWEVGSKRLVQWDSTTIPSGLQAANISLLLGYSDGTVVDHNYPLATDILVASNETSIVVPNVTPGNHSYVVTVSGPLIFGTSQNFTIEKR